MDTRRSIKIYRRGFTLLEVLVAVVIVGILAGVVLASLSQVRMHGRDTERSADLGVILNAVYQYTLDNGNQLPASITTTPTNICQTGAASCTGLIDLSVLTTNQKYLVSIPVDPLSTSTTDTKYAISKNAAGRVTVSAPNVEGTTTMSYTK